MNYIISLLSEFGKYGRYYNLDVVTGKSKLGKNIKASWQEYEAKLLTTDSPIVRSFENHNKLTEAYRRVIQKIIIKLERFLRAISRQFTLGNLGELAKQFSPAVYPFLMLDDDKLGPIDYRHNTTNYKKKDTKRHKRTLLDEIERKTKTSYQSRKCYKSEFEGDWPFYHDEVIIECRDEHWWVVSINGYDYALNGAAKGRYKLEDVHEAGMAILGKSVGPFMNIALDLGKKEE